MEEIEILSKMPWRKLLVSNGITALIGSIALITYFHNHVFSKEEAESLKAEVHEIRQDMTALMLQLAKRVEHAKND